MSKKISVSGTIVEGPGDEMTAVFWPWIRDRLVLPFVDVPLETYDLGLPNREATADQVTIEFADAILRHKVGVKCATITANADRVKEFGLTKMWKSPNATIRGRLDGTIFRAPIIVPGIKPTVSCWSKPIVVARHGYGDIYSGKEIAVPGAGKVELVFTPEGGGEPIRQTVHQFSGPGVTMAMHNIDDSVRSFAQMCINYALETKLNLWFSAKDTISQTYHARFRDIFAEEVKSRQAEFDAAGISYTYRLIDDSAASLAKDAGGFVLAMMNFDGDVWSDFIASAFGSLGLMTSVLCSPKGCWEYEAAHGTVTRHYRKHQKGEVTSTNSVASIYAWSGALRKRGELDGNQPLVTFADKLEAAVISTIKGGVMTGDLIKLIPGTITQPATTEGFIDVVAQTLSDMIAG